MSERENLDHPKQIVDSLKTLKNEDKLCDVTITIGQEELKAHRLVLMAASKYFEAMFLNETKEAKTGIVEFVETPPEIVKQCIEFIYTGKADFSVENAKDFLNASEMMQLDGLTKIYVQFLSERVNAENCIELITLAQTYVKDDLKKCVQDFLLKNFDTFSKADSFLSLDQNQLKYFFTLLKACGEELEILKWKGILSWVKSDVENRKIVFSDLFKLIDLSYLSKQFLKDNIIPEPLVKDTNECLCIVTNSAFRDQDAPKASSIRQGTLSHILACSRDSGFIHQYDIENKVWSKLTQIPESQEMQHMDIVFYKGVIYVGTGNCLYSYSWYWRTLSSAQHFQPAYNRCVGCGDTICMIAVDLVSTYNLLTGNAYRRTGGCKLGVGFFAAASDKVVYAMGGSGTGRSARSISLGESSPISSMNNSRSLGIGFWLNNMLYALGGGPQSVECYNPTTDRWQTIKYTNIPCKGLKAYVGEKLYIFGGSQSVNPFSVDLEKLKIPEDEVICMPNVDMQICCAKF